MLLTTYFPTDAKVESDKITASTGGWFSGWWGGGGNNATTSVADKFGLTTDEKDTLYQAIGLVQ